VELVELELCRLLVPMLVVMEHNIPVVVEVVELGGSVCLVALVEHLLVEVVEMEL
tara:strand:- start:175 stop:339 length:165 start_codon:yes stop_codon:yes gene_type:complete